MCRLFGRVVVIYMLNIRRSLWVTGEGDFDNFVSPMWIRVYFCGDACAARAMMLELLLPHLVTPTNTNQVSLSLPTSPYPTINRSVRMSILCVYVDSVPKRRKTTHNEHMPVSVNVPPSFRGHTHLFPGWSGAGDRNRITRQPFIKHRNELLLEYVGICTQSHMGDGGGAYLLWLLDGRCAH